MFYRNFNVQPFQVEGGWQASVWKSDGHPIVHKGAPMPQWRTNLYRAEEDALREALRAIDAEAFS